MLFYSVYLNCLYHGNPIPHPQSPYKPQRDIIQVISYFILKPPRVKLCHDKFFTVSGKLSMFLSVSDVFPLGKPPCPPGKVGLAPTPLYGGVGRVPGAGGIVKGVGYIHDVLRAIVKTYIIIRPTHWCIITQGVS